MRNYLTVFISFIFISCQTQQQSNHLVFPDINWEINIPESFKQYTKDQNDSIDQASLNRIRQLYPDKFQNQKPTTKTLFTIDQGSENIFDASTAQISKYLSSDQFFSIYKKQSLSLIAKIHPEVQVVDTSYNTETIGGISFYKLYVKTFDPIQNSYKHGYVFYCRKNNYELMIQITFKNEFIGQKFIKVLKSSKFYD